MKKLIRLILLAISVFILAACGTMSKSLKLADAVEVKFYGLDSRGKSDYTINYDQAISDTFGKEGSELTTYVQEHPEEVKEVNDEIEGSTITIDPSLELSNGETVTITATAPKNAKYVKDSSREVTVEGLTDPEVLTSQAVERGLKLNFQGYSGRGSAKIEKTPVKELQSVNWIITKDGQLANGQQATIEVNEDFKTALENRNYVVEEDFNPQIEVKGLDEVADNPNDISNLNDILQIIEQDAKRDYPDSGLFRNYKLNLEGYYYRQFGQGSGIEDTDEDRDAGHLVALYTVAQTDRGGNQERKMILVQGKQNIIVNSDKEANLRALRDSHQTYENNESLESVKALLEADGYKAFSPQNNQEKAPSP